MTLEEDYKLNALHLKPNDVIVITFNPNKINLDDAEQIFRNIKNSLIHTPIIGVFEGVTLTTENKEDLINYLKSI